MKLFVFALLVAAAVAAPIDDSDVVGLIVNGVPDGEAVELGGIVGIKVQEHVVGEVIASTDLLHPLTAVGIAEAAAATAEAQLPIAMSPEYSDVIPEAVSLPGPALPEIVPAPISLPAPALPEFNPAPVSLPAPVKPEVQMIPESVALPAPVKPEVQIIPEAVALPAPVEPEVMIPDAVVLPAAAAPEVQELPVPSAQNIGEIFNDGTVQVTVNAPESGIISTIQGWFSMVMNYISDGDIKTQQIV